ncbi:MAG: hypothetical protein HQK54_06765, partial [Oligoflexales bacterium]|nr:hypothetical protein [Oligoflexales bacterium]
IILADTGSGMVYEIKGDFEFIPPYKYFSAFVAENPVTDNIDFVKYVKRSEMKSVYELSYEDIHHPVWYILDVKNSSDAMGRLVLEATGGIKTFMVKAIDENGIKNDAESEVNHFFAFARFLLKFKRGSFRIFMRSEGYLQNASFFILVQDVGKSYETDSTITTLIGVIKVIILGGIANLIISSVLFLWYFREKIPLYYFFLLNALFVYVYSITCQISTRIDADVMNLIKYDTEKGYLINAWPYVIISLHICFILLTASAGNLYDLRNKSKWSHYSLILIILLMFQEMTSLIISDFYLSRLNANLNLLAIFLASLICVLKYNDEPFIKKLPSLGIVTIAYSVVAIPFFSVVNTLKIGNELMMIIFCLASIAISFFLPVIFAINLNKRQKGTVWIRREIKSAKKEEIYTMYNHRLIEPILHYQDAMSVSFRHRLSLRGPNHWYGLRRIDDRNSILIAFVDVKRQGSQAAILKGFLTGIFHAMEILDDEGTDDTARIERYLSTIVTALADNLHYKVFQTDILLVLISFNTRCLYIMHNNREIFTLITKNVEDQLTKVESESLKEHFSKTCLKIDMIDNLIIHSKNVNNEELAKYDPEDLTDEKLSLKRINFLRKDEDQGEICLLNIHFLKKEGSQLPHNDAVA